VRGYWYAALERDDSFKGLVEEHYKQDTDKSGQKVHNESRFGFCAYPDSDGEGKFQFKVNENNTIFRESPTKPRTSFPSDEELKSYWSRID